MRKLYIALVLCAQISCEKFLDVKPEENLNTISSAKKMWELLDNIGLFNTKFPNASEEVADNYSIIDADFQKQRQEHRRLYLWQKDDETLHLWAYKQVRTTNEVLAAHEKLRHKEPDQSDMNHIKGTALFFRAYYFFGIAMLFAPPYETGYLHQPTGIPLRTDISNLPTTGRPTLQETYDRITTDLLAAADLLPLQTSLKTRPCKAAAFGALARVYHSINNYGLAARYADSCLHYNNALLDYNTLNTGAAAPFDPSSNPEIIFHMTSAGSPLLSLARTDTNLYRSYMDGDLRKQLFFKTLPNGNDHGFKGDYDGMGNSSSIFTGIVTDEIYLIRAECYARNNEPAAAIRMLNLLLIKRWEHGKFKPCSTEDSKEALAIILRERRKELLFRGSRWIDMRRLRNDPELRIIPERIIAGKSYKLLPESDAYTLQIPRSVIENSGVQQNP